MDKLYCFVDETGQDTKGKFFLVSVVISGAEREHLGKLLNETEQQSGKLEKKWPNQMTQNEVYISKKRSALRRSKGICIMPYTRLRLIMRIKLYKLPLGLLRLIYRSLIKQRLSLMGCASPRDELLQLSFANEESVLKKLGERPSKLIYS